MKRYEMSFYNQPPEFFVRETDHFAEVERLRSALKKAIRKLKTEATDSGLGELPCLELANELSKALVITQESGQILTTQNGCAKCNHLMCVCEPPSAKAVPKLYIKKNGEHTRALGFVCKSCELETDLTELEIKVVNPPSAKSEFDLQAAAEAALNQREGFGFVVGARWMFDQLSKKPSGL